MLILLQLRNVASFVNSLQEQEKKKKEKEKRSIFSYLLQKTKNKLFIHLFILSYLSLKSSVEEKKRAKINCKN